MKHAPVTRFIVAVNLLVFLWEIATMGVGILSGNVTNGQIVDGGALVPALVTQNHEYWRILTGAFLHASILHVAVNMYSLYVLGGFVEAVIGSPRLFVVYAVSLVASGLSVVYFSTPDVPTLGASGAIFGIFGALFAIGFKFGRHGMDLVLANLPILILNLIFTFTVANISWQAHVGGLFAGFVVTLAVFFPPKRVRPHVIDAASGNALDTEYESPRENVTPNRR